MNDIQQAIFVGAQEESGIWEILNDISRIKGISGNDALALIKNEFAFLLSRDDLFLVRSEKLYDSDTCQIIDKRKILELTLADVGFKTEGPFYYFSSSQGI